MASDKDAFVDSFQQQIKLLQDLAASVQEAINTAQGRLDKMTKEGKSVEEVFGKQ